jgi:TPR repeat protein
MAFNREEKNSEMLEAIVLHAKGRECIYRWHIQEAYENFLKAAALYPPAKIEVWRFLQEKFVNDNRQSLGFWREQAVSASDWCEKASYAGDLEARRYLGLCCEYGIGITLDLPRAISLYHSAAEEGNAAAQLYLGRCYEIGKGVPQSFQEAKHWYRRAAQQGNILAQVNLGNLNEQVDRDLEKAVRWYQSAAGESSALAQNYLGNCYLNGKGVEKNAEEGVRLYHAAVSGGCAEAFYNLGMCYEQGRGGLPPDLEGALGLYHDGAERGSVDAQARLAFLDEQDQRYFKETLRAAQQGHPIAQNDVGRCYELGKGVPQDFEEAVHWYYVASEKNVEAQFNVGRCFELGRGVRKNVYEAIRWYQRAAKQGNAEARTALEDFI